MVLPQREHLKIKLQHLELFQGPCAELIQKLTKQLSLENDLLHIEERSSLRKVDEFGSSIGKSVLKYRVQVRDNTVDDVVFQEFVITDFSSRADTLDGLAEHALLARSKRMEELEHKLDATKERTEITKNILELTAAHIIAATR